MVQGPNKPSSHTTNAAEAEQNQRKTTSSIGGVHNVYAHLDCGLFIQVWHHVNPDE
jgi:hypothetical protein